MLHDSGTHGAEEPQRELFTLGRQLSRRDLLRLAGAAGGLAAAGALLAACGGSSKATATTGSGGATAASGGTTPTSGGTAASPTSPSGSAAGSAKLVNGGGTAPSGPPSGELKIALQADPTSLDPAATYSLNNGRWQENVFSGLTWRDTNLVLYDGQDGRPGPDQGFGLASSWQYTDDKTLTVKLKPNITFHNGEALNADAVKATFTRMQDPALKSPQAFNYTAIQSVDVVDDLTVTLHFANVDPVMITKLAGYGGFIVPPKAAADATAFGTQTAPGTGPYKTKEYVKDDHLTLEAVDNYWGPRKPHIKTLTYRVIPDDNTRLSEFLAGGVDVLTLNVSQADAAKGNPNVSVNDIGVPTVNGLRLDAKQAPTDNKQVRQAIAHAIDMPTIVSTVLGGYAKQVAIWQSPFSFGYEDDLQPYPFDANMAKQLLQQSGVATPVHVTYDVIGSDTQAKEMASAIKDMLDAVGFNVELREHEAATYYDDYVAGKLGNIVPFGWGGWTLDYDNTYYSMHYTKQSYNPSYSNPEVDKLLDQERNTLDPNQRLDIAKQVNKILYDDAPDVALYQQVYLWGVSNKVKNFSIPPDERLWWLDAWVEG
jgi:peptide/nickel transport system substrate-binding protein